MNTLYDSEAFAVVHMQHEMGDQQTDATGNKAASAAHSLIRHGFEIVDKRTGREVYLDGGWAEIFHAQIQHWQHNTPTQEEVEATLDSYTGLAQHPVVVH